MDVVDEGFPNFIPHPWYNDNSPGDYSKYSNKGMLVEKAYLECVIRLDYLTPVS